MNAAVTKLKPDAPEVAADPLALLRTPFPDNLISKLPKETKKQTEQRKADMDKGNWPAKCTVCDGFHHPNAVHLDYVGHAALTHRLLDVDPHWSWEPMAFRDGLPAFDTSGGLWIKLTVCGVTRLGYGHAAAKPGMDPGAREKEVIGDALRNAAMRFGAALDLWHKGDLHVEEADDTTPGKSPQTVVLTMVKTGMDLARTRDELVKWQADNKSAFSELSEADLQAARAYYKTRFDALAPAEAAPSRENETTTQPRADTRAEAEKVFP